MVRCVWPFQLCGAVASTSCTRMVVRPAPRPLLIPQTEALRPRTGPEGRGCPRTRRPRARCGCGVVSEVGGLFHLASEAPELMGSYRKGSGQFIQQTGTSCLGARFGTRRSRLLRRKGFCG